MIFNCLALLLSKSEQNKSLSILKTFKLYYQIDNNTLFDICATI